MPFASAGNAASARPSRRAARGAACARARRRGRGTRPGSPRIAPPRPRAAARPRAPMPVGEGLEDPVGDEEVGVLGPAVEALRLLDALGAERLAVRLRRVLDRRAVADVAVDEDQRRALVLGLEDREGPLHLLEVVGVGDRRHVPAVGGEPRRDVLGEREVGVALDRHPVRVVDPAEVREPLMAGEGRGLRRDALHHAAVPGLGVDVEVEEGEAVAVVARAEPLAGDRHPDRRRDALAERAGGRLDAARPAVLGVARAACDPSWRKRFRSSSETAGSPRISYSGSTDRTPVRCRSDHSNADACPAESTKRSRFGQIGSDGSNRRNRCQSVYVTGAMPTGVPG